MVPPPVAESERAGRGIAEARGIQASQWDWQYYAEQLRKKRYSMDEAQAKQYFEHNRVLQTAFSTPANKLYGVTFKERHDLAGLQSRRSVFAVFDVDGKQLALWYADYYSRPNKSGGAWMDTFVDQSRC